MDKTGLQGLYDIQTDGWSPQLPAPTSPENLNAGERTPAEPLRPTLFGLLETLGLKLEPVSGTIEVLTIDNAGMPDPN